jgi:hypothetical protein
MIKMSEKFIFRVYSCDILTEKIVRRLRDFIYYNPDDLGKTILKKIVKQAISEIFDLIKDDNYIALFFSKMQEFFQQKGTLKELLEKNDVDKLKEILSKSEEYAINASMYYTKEGKLPSREELDAYRDKDQSFTK